MRAVRISMTFFLVMSPSVRFDLMRMTAKGVMLDVELTLFDPEGTLYTRLIVRPLPPPIRPFPISLLTPRRHVPGPSSTNAKCRERDGVRQDHVHPSTAPAPHF